MTQHRKDDCIADVLAALEKLREEMDQPHEPWPLGYNKNGIPITLIPPSLYDAALEQNPDADMSMYQRHELPKVGAWTHPKDLERMHLAIDATMLQHMTGEPMPGWEVPLHVGIDPGSPEGDRTVLAISDGASMKLLEETLPQCLRPEGLPDTVWRGEGAHRMGASQSFWDAAEKHPRVIAELERRRAEVQKAASKPVPMLTKQVDRILSNHGRARPPQMPRNLRIYIRPSYPWFHSCGYAVGHARVSPPLKPMRIVSLAVQYLALAPTLTHQA